MLVTNNSNVKRVQLSRRLTESAGSLDSRREMREDAPPLRNHQQMPHAGDDFKLRIR